MNKNELVSLWNRTSDKSLVLMMTYIEEWCQLAAVRLSVRKLSPEVLADALEAVVREDWAKGCIRMFENQVVAHILTAEQVRRFLGIDGLSEPVRLDLGRRLCGSDATVDELIALTHDPDPSWRKKATREFLKRDATFAQWEQVLQCWGDEKHADVAVLLWNSFRKHFPKLNLGKLFEIAFHCSHVQDEVVKHYLQLKPEEFAASVEEAHCLSEPHALGMGDWGVCALWVKERLDDSQKAKMFRKAEQFLAYSRKLEKKN